MASRMDRYSKTERVSSSTARSDRNKSLYKKIEDLDSYTNIVGITNIENKNSIDIEKVRELLKSREEKNEVKKIEEIPTREDTEEEEEFRNYDIKDLLSKVKENNQDEEQKYRSLSSKHQKILRELNRKNKKIKEEEKELSELVKTITNMKAIDDPDDVGLLDDLKSDTMVGDAASIKQIIEEEKDFNEDMESEQLDKSFYTSSFGFTKRDFEELKDMNHKIKKDNKFIIILLIVLITLLVVGATFLLMNIGTN